MINIGGLILELVLLLGTPIIIPIIIVIVAEKLSYNEKIKSKIIMSLSFIYNGIIGFLSPIIFFCSIFLVGSFLHSQKLLYLIISIIIGIIIVPINIYMMKKCKTNKILYFVLNVIIFILFCAIRIATMRGSIDL